ncbi:PAS domain S-box protein [Candidatus Venteria ishoeyi]|uniref:Putative diguanylate cyclase n=1 Tax=Candidatus Venteria ishoeyi TaxID=1899563 RepID=A0A1H6F5J1_9GAMM|nr:PAS domain S-box protein [Candidatus Venteria ishoeyi]SEH05438.1 putative diguanylate cyclase [Candidatus Venteria ishoeyi]
MKDLNSTELKSYSWDLSQDLMCIAGFDGYFKYLNPSWEKLLGYNEEELLSKPFLDFIHPDDHHKNDEEVSNLSKGINTINFKNRYICKNGSIKYIEWIAAPLAAENIIYCIGRDITERILEEKKKEGLLHNLGERVKELNCLYGMTRIVERPGITLEGIIEETVSLIPSSWQYPGITCAKIRLKNKEYKTDNFLETKWTQSASILHNKKIIGEVGIWYLEEKPESDEGPFLKRRKRPIRSYCRTIRKCCRTNIS